MRKELEAFLWRRAYGPESATVKTLLNKNRGQYHITLNSQNWLDFFVGFEPTNSTSNGGYSITVPIQRLDGPEPVGEKEIIVRYMGSKSSRKDWNFPQQSSNPYELWREGRGFESQHDVGDRDYIVIARDTDNHYHARWIRTVDFDSLPEKMKMLMQDKDVGWSTL